MLDYYDENPISRIPKTTFKCIEGLKAHLAQYLRIPSVVPYVYQKSAFSSAASGNKKIEEANKSGKMSSNQPKREYPSQLQKPRMGAKATTVELTKSFVQDNHPSLTVQKICENTKKRAESIVKVKEHKLNAGFLPPIGKSQERVNKGNNFRSKMTVKPIDFHKSRRVWNGQKKAESSKNGARSFYKKS